MFKKIISFCLIIHFVILPCIIANADEEKTILDRAGFANELMNSYEYITQEFSLPMAERPVFSDIDSSPFNMRIIQAHVMGFVNGVGDEKFLPNEYVTKCQVAVGLYRLVLCLNQKYNLTQEEHQSTILDIETAPDWATEAIGFMVSTELMPLKENKFYPDEFMSEDELIEITDKIQNLFVPSDDRERIDFETFLKNRGN